MKMLVSAGDTLPGTAPPISAQCTKAQPQAIIFPSWK